MKKSLCKTPFILKVKNGEIICNKMIVAENILNRMQGLMFSEKMPECDGFLIDPCRSIHTFFMLYSLDILFLDKNFKVVKILYDLTP